MSNDPVIDGLRKALEVDPSNGSLRVHLAELLEKAGREEEAIAELRVACQIDDVRRAASRALVPLLRRAGHLDEALLRAEALLAEGGDDELREEMALIQEARGRGDEAAELRGAGAGDEPREAAASIAGDRPDDDWASQFDWGDLHVTFDDVVGLDAVKKQIRLRILAPFEQPDVYAAFGRSAGGGVLLYGPPGCGKTYVARATAGELGARFLAVGIHDVIDKYWGESEKLVHNLFEEARRNSPTVLFFDEFDALGSKRAGTESQFWKTLVDQLLQEMDGVKGGKGDILLLAATNAPWGVDSAFRRPGRFDRVLFVPPPDKGARQELLRRRIEKVPGGAKVDVGKLAKRSDGFTGADLEHLIERASEGALERSLDEGRVCEVAPIDFDSALDEMQSSAREWLETAKNYARYGNEGGQYDDLAKYLRKNKLL